MKNIIVIPARLNSTRLPRKVLLDLGGKPVIQHVYERCKKVISVNEVYIAVDNVEVLDICKQFTDSAIITSEDHQSGTDRIAEIVHKVDCDNVINVQGDEPFIDPILISNVLDALENPTVDISTACVQIKFREEIFDPNVVKVVKDESNYALYFSRSPIPYDRDDSGQIGGFFRHLGIYGYKKTSLLKFVNYPLHFLESIEKLEQLRALANCMKIKVIESQHTGFGIDTKEDLEKARDLIRLLNV